MYTTYSVYILYVYHGYTERALCVYTPQHTLPFVRLQLNTVGGMYEHLTSLNNKEKIFFIIIQVLKYLLL
jgi:hypothetical protein